MGRLNGKVALSTDGSRGIAEPIAKLFARAGEAVVVTGRRQEPLTRVVQTIEQAGGRALTVAGSAETPLTEATFADPTIKTEVLAAYPLRRSCTPEAVARMVLSLGSAQAAWATGVIFPIDGGMTAGSPLRAESV